ncbi:MAG: hypothetical protein KAH17_00185 [Bacteroidales bacterium]|nr:hypothetical protein [Bacteroidales bacterium]
MTSDIKKSQKQSEQDEKILKLVRILARGIGILLFLIMLINAIGQGGIDRLISLNGTETISFVCILTMFFGIIWANQKEIAGGILIIVSYIVFAINIGSIIPDAVIPIFFFTGILHIYAGLIDLKQRKMN